MSVLSVTFGVGQLDGFLARTNVTCALRFAPHFRLLSEATGIGLRPGSGASASPIGCSSGTAWHALPGRERHGLLSSRLSTDDPSLVMRFR